MTKTYSETLQNIRPSGITVTAPSTPVIPAVAPNFRSILDETRNETLAEDNEKKLRDNNHQDH